MSKWIQGVPMYWGAQVIRAERLPSILKWAGGKGLNIQAFDKKYLVSFQDRNNRESEHLMITNYDQEANLTLWNELETASS